VIPLMALPLVAVPAPAPGAAGGPTPPVPAADPTPDRPGPGPVPALSVRRHKPPAALVRLPAAPRPRKVPPPAQEAPAAPTGPDGWERWAPRVARCESGGRYDARNPRSSASGRYQALRSTWGGYGGYPEAWMAPPDVQEAHAAELYAQRGLRPWRASRSCWARTPAGGSQR
jgi:Transglycosylase-like domain.